MRRPRSHRRRQKPRVTLVWIAQHSIAIALSIMFLAPVVYPGADLADDQRPGADQQLLAEDVASGELRHGVPEDAAADATCSTPSSTRGSRPCFMLLSSVPAAYALAKLRWRGRNVVFLTVICMMMLPPQVVTVPLYLMWAKYGLTGTLWPLIMPMLFGDAFSIFLLRQFLLTIPQRVPGRGPGRRLRRVADAAAKVVLPMARPGIAAAGTVPVLLRLERLLRAVAVHQRERVTTGRCRWAWPRSTVSTTWTGTW